MQISSLNGFNRFQPEPTTTNISNVNGYQMEGPVRVARRLKRRIKSRDLDNPRQRRIARRGRKINPATENIKRSLRIRERQGQRLRPEVKEDLLDYVNDCKCEGIKPTLNGFLEGRKERQARRKARQTKRQQRREQRKIERTGRKSERERKRTQIFERSARGQRRDRRQKRLAERKAKREGRQSARKLRIAERRKRVEARQQARTERRKSRQDERALKQAEKSGRAGIFGRGFRDVVETGKDLAQEFAPGNVSEFINDPRIEQFTDPILDNFLGPDDTLMEKDLEMDNSTSPNFWQKYGVWIAGAGAVGLLLYANALNKPKKKKR